MRRLIIAIFALFLLAAYQCAAQPSAEPPTDPPEAATSHSGSRPENSDSNVQRFFENLRRYMPGSSDLFRIGDTFFGDFMWLKWPDKRITLDVKNASIMDVAMTLEEQTGLEFIVSEGVPTDLKITIHVSKMRVKEFLDTFTSTTNLTYVVESRQIAEESPDPKVTPGTNSPTPDFGTSTPDTRRRDGPPIPKRMQNVTRVTILNPRTEGVVVNMGKVSASLKRAEPIEAVTNLIKQIKGANYVVMSLDDYLTLQTPGDAALIKEAIRKTSRRRVTLEIRNAPVADALTQLAEAGKFYITIPKPGIPSFLIIPDVTLDSESNLPSPPISYWSTTTREAREQGICMEYTGEMTKALLEYARENGGTLPEAAKWVELVPLRNEYLERRMPGGRYQYSYGMNFYLSGMKLSDIKNPAQTVLIFECDNNQGYGTEDDVIRSLRHPGGVVYGFADGSVRILTEKPTFKP